MRPGVFGLIGGIANPSGVALILILSTMVICSLPFVRRGGYFEVTAKSPCFKNLILIFLYRAEAPFYALATPRPRQPDKIMPDGARQEIAGSVWFPGPKIGRKIEGSWPDSARQHQILFLFVNKVKF